MTEVFVKKKKKMEKLVENQRSELKVNVLVNKTKLMPKGGISLIE